MLLILSVLFVATVAMAAKVITVRAATPTILQQPIKVGTSPSRPHRSRRHRHFDH